jgi:hypothetical protein
MPLTQVQPGMLGTPQFYGFKNRIINGDMGIWQRGTSFSNPSVGGSFYTADRWGVNRASDVSGATVSRSTDVPSGFQYSLKLQRTAGNTSTAGLYLFNSNETANTLDLAGQSVTISFWVKTGANYSGGALSIQGYWGTGTDQRVYAYTGATAFINTTQAITSTWTRYSFTGSVGASSTEVGCQFFWTPTGTAGADDSIYITGCQLELGVSPTSFDFLSIGTELQLCQRYYYQVTAGSDSFTQFAMGRAFSGTAGNGVVQFPVPMRTKPVFAFLGVVGNYDFSPTGISGGAVPASNTHMTVGMTFSSITSGSIFVLGQNSSSTPCGFTFNAEL